LRARRCDPMAGGCARKVDFQSLVTLLAGSGRRPAQDLGDAFEVTLTPPWNGVVTSVDLLYMFGDDAQRFGQIAAVHAMSDLFASLSTPALATLALGVSIPDLQTGRAADAIEGVAAGLQREGAALAGGHTVFAAEMFASVSVVGDAPRARPSGPAEPGDALLISKPLGSGLALTARHLGVASDEDLEALYASMALSNGGAARLLSAALDRIVGAIHSVTDVSGFGFLDAVRNVASRATVRVDLGTIPVIEGTNRWLDAQAGSSLMDSNVMMSDTFTTYLLDEGSGRARAILNDPQTSGGLVVIATPTAAADLEASGVFARVGEIEVTDVPLRIEIVSETKATLGA
jgi:selenide,water dikinase